MRNDSRVMVAAVRINTRVVICQSAKEKAEEEEEKTNEEETSVTVSNMVGKHYIGDWILLVCFFNSE